MAQLIINTGNSANDGTGDPIRLAGIKINGNMTELYDSGSGSSDLTFIQNNISSISTNSNIALAGNGTGSVHFRDLTIDNTINMSDNNITVTNSNQHLVLNANGTGTVQSSTINIDGGEVDGTAIGATTPAAGTFTTITFSPAASGVLEADLIKITDNNITTNVTNGDIEFDAAGTGVVTLNDIGMPVEDAATGLALQTDGNGQLSFVSVGTLFDNTIIEDATASISGSDSSAQVVDTFQIATYRSAKYHIQISSPTGDYYSLIEANVTHDGTSAYVGTFMGVNNLLSDGSTSTGLDFDADISGGNVRLLATVNNTNDHSIKLVKRLMKV